MPLSSKLFRGDPALEAAANIASAHIQTGARGPHVAKIQTALNILNSANLRADGIYGQATAAAVRNYKTKRDIVNRAYQESADNIVGIMTMAKLDEEMRAHESKPQDTHVELIPISPRADFEKAYPRFNFKISESNALVPVRTAHVLPVDAITINMGQTGEIEVKNGDGYFLLVRSIGRIDFKTAVLLVDPSTKNLVTQCDIKGNSVVVQIKGVFFGPATLVAGKPGIFGATDVETLAVNVRDPRPTIFHPTSAHHHEPVLEPDEWNKVCEEAAKDPNLGFFLTRFARNKASPPIVVAAAKGSLLPLSDFLAQLHLDYYLGGRGGVLNEDDNLKRWIEGDKNARTVISRRILEARRGDESPVHVMFEFNQKSYDDDDARQSFGTIDNLEVSVDFVLGKVFVWFEDTYEWHPTYSQYTKPFRCPDDVPRDTVFGHAALVQMKTRGAKDFQMRGQAEFPMRIFPNL
jgi:hypothetical protein